MERKNHGAHDFLVIQTHPKEAHLLYGIYLHAWKSEEALKLIGLDMD